MHTFKAIIKSRFNKSNRIFSCRYFIPFVLSDVFTFFIDMISCSSHIYPKLLRNFMFCACVKVKWYLDFLNKLFGLTGASLLEVSL